MSHARGFRFVALLVVSLTLTGLVAPGQATVTRVTPEVGAPGDLVTITGTGLGLTTGVRFGAFVGGFTGYWTVIATPVTVSPTMVTAIVPEFGNFLPTQFGSDPVGSVEVESFSAVSPFVPFLFLEHPDVPVATAGLGTTQGGNGGLPAVAGFAIAGGVPLPGNATCTFTLENAEPSSPATFVVGSPAPLPVGYLDGIIPIDLSLPFGAFDGGFVTDAFGDLAWNVPIPPWVSGTFTLFWVIAPASLPSVPGMSNGLTLTL